MKCRMSSKTCMRQIFEDYNDAEDNSTIDAQNLLDDPVAVENATKNTAGEHLL